MLNAESGRVRRIALGLGGGLVVLCVLLALWIWRRSEPEPPAASSRDTVEISSATSAPEAPQPAATAKKAEQTIQGTVWYDQEHSKPAAGVSVTARNCGHPNNSTRSVTDAEGRYVLQAYAPDTSYALLAEEEATGLVSVECPVVPIARGESVENADLVLGKGGSISGHVIGESLSYSPQRLSAIQRVSSFLQLSRSDLEKSKERPLTGVELTLTGTGSIEIERTATSNAQGLYLFDDLPAGSYRITPKRPQGAIVDDKEVVQSAKLKYPGTMQVKGIDFRFRVDGLTIMGHVSDTQRQPLAGAEIVVKTLYESEPGAGGADTTGTTKTVCDSEGNYRVEALRTMTLDHAHTFMSSGTAAVRQVVHAQMKGYESAEIIVPAITQDLAQTAEAIRLTAEQLDIEGNKGGWSGELPEVQGRVISGVDFVLARGAAVSGTLVNRQGSAVTKCGLFLEPLYTKTGDEHSGSSQLWTTTDDSGRFSFEALGPNSYTFYCYSTVPVNTPNRLNADNEPLTLAAGERVADYVVVIEGDEDRGGIVGRVLDAATRTPPNQFEVKVLSVERSDSSSGGTGEAIVTDPAKGEFAVRGASPGGVTLRVDAEGYGPAIEQVEVSPGKSTDVTILLPRGGGIEGTVTLNGEPWRKTVIQVYLKEGGPYLDQSLPDETGYFQTSVLGAGTYLVAAELELPGQFTKRRDSKWVTVEADRIRRADFSMEGTATLSGVFSFPSTYKNGIVVVRETRWRDTPLPIHDWPAFYNQVMAQVFLREAGQYTIEALPSGDFIVTGVCFNDPGGGTEEKAEILESSYEIHVEPGKSVTLDLELR